MMHDHHCSQLTASIVWLVRSVGRPGTEAVILSNWLLIAFKSLMSSFALSRIPTELIWLEKRSRMAKSEPMLIALMESSNLSKIFLFSRFMACSVSLSTFVRRLWKNRSLKWTRSRQSLTIFVNVVCKSDPPIIKPSVSGPISWSRRRRGRELMKSRRLSLLTG